MGFKMKEFIVRNWQIFLISLGLFASLWTLTRAIRVGVDPYHEGALFPSAVGFAQGLTVFKDVNNQYGFMYAIIQAPFIYLFGNYLLVERIVGVLIFILNAILFYRIIRLKLRPKMALFSVLLLCAINPSWSYLSNSSLGGYAIWVNQYGITFTLLSVSILFENIRKSAHSNLFIFISSFVGFCASYMRLEFAAIWVLQLIFVSLGGIHKTRKSQDFLMWVSGGLSALSLGVLFLSLTGGLSDAIKQLVTVWFSNPPNSAHLGLGNILTLLASCISFIYLVVCVKFVLRFKYWPVYTFVIILGNLVLIRLSLHDLPNLKIFGKLVGPYLFTSFDGILLNYSSGLLLLILFLVIFQIWTRNLVINSETGFLLVTSLGLVAQLHNVNSAYIYMFNPIFLACVLLYVHQEKLLVMKSNLPKSLLATMSILIVVSLINGLFLVSKTTYSYKSPILRGMLSGNLVVRDEIDRKYKLLNNSINGRNVFMDCPDGLYSVSENGLISADKWTWNEIPEKWRVASLSKAKVGQFILHCAGDEKQSIQYAQWEGLGIIKSAGELPNFHLYRVLKSNSVFVR
jgi:hypothetical protein